MAKKKMAKAAVKKAHRIARSVAKSGSARNPYAVGMAAEQRHLAKQRAKKRKR